MMMMIIIIIMCTLFTVTKHKEIFTLLGLCGETGGKETTGET